MTDRRESSGGREIRIAALGDMHFNGDGAGDLRDLFAEIDRGADVLALCGDLTTHGRPDQMRQFVDELAGVHIPIVCVLGNHDHEGEAADELTALLKDRGVHVLDGDHVVIDGVGFAGTKGFVGGFGRGALAPFGEKLIKDFVQAALDESIKLENALRNLDTDTKIALLHFSPVTDTIVGEPEYIHPFLGSSRLLEPLETYGASVIFHGHAHHGTAAGRTPSGIPVHNVALPLLRKQNRRYLLWSTPAPDRRKRENDE